MKIKKIFSAAIAAIVSCAAALSFAGCSGEKKSVYKIYMPDGAPAIAMSALMASGYEGASFTVVSAAAIDGAVGSGQADLAILPVDTAARIYNGGADIVMLTVNTHGNLYIVGDEAISEIDDLVGKRLALIGKGKFPDMTARLLFDRYGLKYEESNDAVDGKVALRYIDDGSKAPPLFTAGSIDYALLAEPAATNISGKLGKTIAADVQELWDTAFTSSNPQACLIAKGKIVDNDKKFIDGFIAALKESDGWAKAHPAEAVSAIADHMQTGTEPSLKTLTADIVERCNVRTVDAETLRTACDAYFTRLTKLPVDELNTFALDKVPSAEFYYKA